MTKPEQPPRLLDDMEEGDLLRLGLAAGRDELPTEEQLGGLWERVISVTGGGPDDPGGDGPEGDPDGGGPEGGPEGGPDGGPAVDPSAAQAAAEAATAGSAATGGSAALLTGTTTKLLGAVAVAAVAIGVSVHYSSPRRDNTTATPVTTVASAAASISAVSVAPPAASIATPSASSSSKAASTPTPPTGATTALLMPTATADAGETKPSEIELLKEARAALSGEPARALALVGRAAQLYPRGALGQEREMIRIQALVGVGKRDQALAAARALTARHPDTAYARRLRSLFPELSAP